VPEHLVRHDATAVLDDLVNSRWDARHILDDAFGLWNHSPHAPQCGRELAWVAHLEAILVMLPNGAIADGRTDPTGARSEASEGTQMAAESDPDLVSKIRARQSERNRAAQPVEPTRVGGARIRTK